MKQNVTIGDIAEELDINISTVSRALNDHPKISNKTKKKVLTKARELSYATNNIASALANGLSNVVGIIVPSIDENFFAKAIYGIDELLKKSGYRVIISQSHDTVEGEKACIQTMLEERVDGIIASHAMETTDFNHYQKIQDKGVTLVFFDRFNESLNTHVVAIDDFRSAYRTTEHLVEQGCQDIAYIGGFSHVHIYNERFKGYRQALTDHNLTLDESMVFEGNMKMEASQKFTEQILRSSHQPDAIFTTSDYSAIGTIQTLKEHDIAIPDTIAVAGFSNEDFASFVTPSLTSTKQHSSEMGRLAAQLFLNQMNDNHQTKISQKTIISTELIVRESTQRC